MENASKALLIAAAILIVIILIAFGMQVLNAGGNAGDQARSTGGAIANQTSAAANAATSAIGSVTGWYETNP